MAAVNFTRFSNIEVLRKIHPDLLMELLWAYRPYFRARGYGLRRKQQYLDYSTIAMILLSPDEAMPMDLVEGLWLTSELGTRRGMDAILSALGESRPPTLMRLSPLDVAVWTYLINRDLLDTLYAQMCVFFDGGLFRIGGRTVGWRFRMSCRRILRPASKRRSTSMTSPTAGAGIAG